MYTIDELLEVLKARGVTIEVAGDKLRLHPKSAIDAGLLGHLRTHKTDLIERVKFQPTTLLTEDGTQQTTSETDLLSAVKRVFHPARIIEDPDFRWYGDTPSERPTNWTAEAERLIAWFHENRQHLAGENFQRQITLAGLAMHVSYGPKARGAGRLIRDLERLRAAPEQFFATESGRLSRDDLKRLADKARWERAE